MDKSKIKVIAMDLDGTLTQHKEKLLESQKQTLDRLKSKYKLLMVGAGQTQRIFNQMNKYPIDIQLQLLKMLTGCLEIAFLNAMGFGSFNHVMNIYFFSIYLLLVEIE